MPFLKQPSRTKKAAPPISPARTQGNQKKTKPNEPSGTNRAVSVDKNKQTEPVVTIPPEPSDNDTINQHGSSWSTVKSKTTTTKEEKTKKAKVSAKSLFESDSDSEDEERDQAFAIPEQNSVYILSPDYAVPSRFSVTFEIDTSLEPDKFLESTILKVNTVLKQLTTEGQLAGYSGRAIIIPWEDTEVYSNRAFRKIPKSIEHTQLLALLRQFLYGYGAPKGRKQDKNVSRKYCRINLAWASLKMIPNDKKELLEIYWTSKCIAESGSFYVSPAPTAAINPTIAVQFRQSILNNPTNWNDKGHEDCLEELNSMIRSFLPPSIKIAGLKKVTFATGQNFMRGDPAMLSLECEKTDEAIVTREMVQIFRSVNRKTQVRDKKTVPWIAVPYFKGGDIQANKKYQPQYANIKAKESVYQAGIMMKYIDGIKSLDTIATEHSHLSREILKQLELDIWNHNETPVRALIYDKLYSETKTELVKALLPENKSISATKLKDIRSKVTCHQVLDAMANKGYDTWAPSDEESFPVPSPSGRTLREYLMSMKSRRVEDAESAPYVFESINNTDDGRVLFTFSEATMDEATTVLDCLPLVIQHEMHLDPPCFLSDLFIKRCRGCYYNPLSRTGVTAVAACLEDEVKLEINPKNRIP
jgi:hypothetical protein